MAKKKDGESSVKTSIVLPEEMHWAFKAVAVGKKLSDTAAIREAIQQWIDRASGPQSALKANRSSRS